MATPTVYPFNRSLMVMSSDNTETSELSGSLFKCGQVAKLLNGDLPVDTGREFPETPEDSESEHPSDEESSLVSDEESDHEVKDKDESVPETKPIPAPPRAVEDGNEDFLRNVMNLIFREGLVDNNDRNM